MVCRLFLSELKLVGLVKYLLNALAIALLEVRVLLLNFMDRFGSVVVGSLLLSDLIVFQYVFWLCLWSHCVFTCCFHICSLFISRLSSTTSG